MAADPGGEVTRLLAAWSEGDAAALDRLVPIVYDELRRIASRALRGERAGHTLQTTALVHEAYMKLCAAPADGGARGEWRNRQQFFAVAAQAMRRILVDHARERQAQKRGGGARPLELDEAVALPVHGDADVLAVDSALAALATVDPPLARIVELKFFGGLNLDEIASVLEVSPSTAWREWNAAKAWLQRELGAAPPEAARP